MTTPYTSRKRMMSTMRNNEVLNDLFYNIDDSLFSEILKRLSMKNLLRCMCVQKSWFHLIRTPDFVKLHSNYHHDRDSDAKYLLFRSVCYSNLLYLRYDDEQCKEFYRLDLPTEIENPRNELKSHSYWLATSYGLICVSDSHVFYGHQRDISLWNPLVNKHKILPALDLSNIPRETTLLTVFAFGYVPSINDYRVARIVCYFPHDREDSDPSFLLCVYSLNTNSWKTKFQQGRDPFFSLYNPYESVFVNGIAYSRCFCPVSSDPTKSVDKILYFDTLNETLGMIPFPQVSNDYHCLHQFGQSLALFVEEHESNTFHMWILVQGSMKNDYFWENKVTVSLENSICCGVIGVRNNGELVLKSNSNKVRGLASYDLENDEVKEFVESCEHWPSHRNDYLFRKAPPFALEPFVGSLALLDTHS